MRFRLAKLLEKAPSSWILLFLAHIFQAKKTIMKQYERITIDKRPEQLLEMTAFAEYLKARFDPRKVKLGDSEYYGIHLKCEFDDGECELFEEKSAFEFVLYSEPETYTQNKAAFDKLLGLFHEWYSA